MRDDFQVSHWSWKDSVKGSPQSLVSLIKSPSSSFPCRVTGERKPMGVKNAIHCRQHASSCCWLTLCCDLEGEAILAKVPPNPKTVLTWRYSVDKSRFFKSLARSSLRKATMTSSLFDAILWRRSFLSVSEACWVCFRMLVPLDTEEKDANPSSM